MLENRSREAANEQYCPIIRESADSDVPAIQKIYAYYVVQGLSTFEEDVPNVAELHSRREAILAPRLPYLVATWQGEVVGYAYASKYRSRSAYRYAIEDSVYVAHDFHAKGIGTNLLSKLIQRCECGPWRQMIAVIGDSGNSASVRLHARLGFVAVGTLKSVGFKLDRWVDTVLMQRQLAAGDRTKP